MSRPTFRDCPVGGRWRACTGLATPVDTVARRTLVTVPSPDPFRPHDPFRAPGEPAELPAAPSGGSGGEGSAHGAPDPLETPEQRVRRVIAESLPHYGTTGLAPVQFAEVYQNLTAVAVARAAFLGKLLAEAFEAEGLGALVGAKVAAAGKDGTLYDASEELRALVVLEAQERERAERLVREGIKMGIEAKRVDVLRGYGRTVVEAMRALCGELGVNLQDEATRRAMQRAVLSARSTLGFDFRPPESAGPELNEEERARVLGAPPAPF